MLLDAGAIVLLREAGWCYFRGGILPSPLMAAAKSGSGEIIRLLLNAGVQIKGDDPRTAREVMDAAASSGSVRIGISRGRRQSSNGLQQSMEDLG